MDRTDTKREGATVTVTALRLRHIRSQVEHAERALLEGLYGIEGALRLPDDAESIQATRVVLAEGIDAARAAAANLGGIIQPVGGAA